MPAKTDDVVRCGQMVARNSFHLSDVDINQAVILLKMTSSQFSAVIHSIPFRVLFGLSFKECFSQFYAPLRSLCVFPFCASLYLIRYCLTGDVCLKSQEH